MAMLFDLGVSAFVAFLISYVIWYFFNRRERSKANFLRDELGIPEVYQWNAHYISDYTDAYFDFLEFAEKKYCKAHNIGPNDPLPETWAQELEAEETSECKRRLMERGLGWVDCYKKLDNEMKRVTPLYRRNMVSKDYWDSIKATENLLESEYHAIRKEAVFLDPHNGPGLFQEAIRFHDRYGFPPNMSAMEKDSSSSEQEGSSSTSGATAPVVTGGGAKAAPQSLSLTQEEYMRCIEKVTDEKTYELTQGPNESELVVFVPYGTKSKAVRCAFTADSITVMLNNKPHFLKKLRAEIKPTEVTWLISQKGLHEMGDDVTLTGLSNKEMNGKAAVVTKPTAAAQKTGRVAVTLPAEDNKLISVKPENLENPKAHKKCYVSITLEKTTQRSIWPMPPWIPGPKELVIRPRMSDEMRIKLLALHKWQAENGDLQGLQDVKSLTYEKREIEEEKESATAAVVVSPTAAVDASSEEPVSGSSSTNGTAASKSAEGNENEEE